MMENIVVFGELPIATKVVKYLEQEKHNIFVVIGNNSPKNNDPWTDTPLLFDYITGKDIKSITLNELSNNYDNNYFTLGLSCRFSKIIKPNILCKFKYGILNMHGGLLPEFGGLYSANHTLLQHSPIGGGTIHYIDQGIDTGLIVKRCQFNILDIDTSYTVFQKTQEVLYAGMIELIPTATKQFINGKTREEFIKEGHSNRYFDKHSLEGLKEIKTQELSTEDINYIIRAFDFPGYEPAYFFDAQGRKVYLRYNI